MGKLEKRVELLENTVLALIDIIEEKLHIDDWDDRSTKEQFKIFCDEMEER